MNPETKQKRANLKALSMQVKPLVKMGVYPKVNDAILDLYAKNNDCTPRDIHTFIGWKERGCMVKKGEKALCIWGHPKKYEVEKDGEKDEYSFFPLCYVFTINQVEANQERCRKTISRLK